MAEIAEELGAMTPADTSIRRLATLMLAASSPERTMTLAAIKKSNHNDQRLTANA